MDSFRLVLAIVGVILIVGIAAHGIWTIRKNNQHARERAERIERSRRSDVERPFANEQLAKKAWEEPVKPLRARKRASAPQQTSLLDELERDDAASDMPDEAAEQPLQFEMPMDEPRSEPAAPSVAANSVPWSDDEEDELSATDSPFDNEAFEPDPESLVEPSDELPEAGSAPTETDPDVAETTRQALPIEPEMEPEPEPEAESEPEPEPEPKEPEIEVISLSITGDIRGAILLQILTELGFKYGDMDIFHRHQDSAGHGPVLFSLANLFKPGTFDLETIETFTSEGIVLFLQLPVRGDAHQAFTMMYNAALKIADAMPRAAVLDGNRNPVTKQSVQQAYQRIREFERQQRVYQAANSSRPMSS